MSGAPAQEEYGLTIPLPEGSLEARVALPAGARGLVLLPQLGAWREPGRIGTLRAALLGLPLGVVELPLLTSWEETLDHFSGRFRFDVELLAGRLAEAVAVLRRIPGLYDLPVGAVAQGTGVAAALLAAARSPGLLAALVSWEGRADLVRGCLPEVAAPTLLLVDGDDEPVLELTLGVLGQLGAAAEMRVLPQEAEPAGDDDLERIAGFAGDWLRAHLAAA
ncbi:MAG TPA: hydrolase [Thermoanaerobaculia bacterium]|nr:hydrolase [Thermoanaerobaculia bacterium]